MLDTEPAKNIVLKYLSENWNLPDAYLVIVDSLTIERDFGWVFFYDSSKHLATGALSDALAGNAPVIVNKHDGSLHRDGKTHRRIYSELRKDWKPAWMRSYALSC
jgi:hypothetical protein